VRLSHYKTTVTLSWLLVISLTLSISAYAQDTQAKYQRKSISYVNSLLQLGVDTRISEEDVAYLLEAIQREMEMPRFDYNPLPDAILATFKNEITKQNITDLDTLAQVMNNVLAPEIMRIVDLEKQMRAQGLVSETERNSFIVQKAKETGITAEDLRAIMNSAYIYVPVLFEVKKSDSETANTISVDLQGGILWFSIKTDQSGSRVELLVKKEAKGSGFAKRDAQKISYGGRYLSGPEYAFYTAAEALAKNLKVATQQIPEFQLTNPVTSTGSGWVEFGMGKKEGLGVDDKFIITEYIENPDGSLHQKKLGMVRISKVADNRDQTSPSRARTVIGSGYERGQLALEHPRLPIDLSFRFALLPFKVTKKLQDDDQVQLKFTDADLKNNFYVGQLFFQYNMAHSSGISQFFGEIYGEIGAGQVQDWKMYGNAVPAGLYWGIGGGLAKKFYINRLHIGLEALASYADFKFSGTGTDATGDHDWKWEVLNLALTLNGNLELALTYDLNLGVGASYRLAGGVKDWTFTRDGGDVDLTNIPDRPEAKFGGLGFQIYMTWSLPSLSYDPLKMVKGSMGI
jgi:hypothetical protein